VEVAPNNLSLLDPLFTSPITHLTGGPATGKSLLLLYYLGYRALHHNERILWVDAGGSFFPSRVRILFGQVAPLVLARILVARVDSLPALKVIASELVSSGNLARSSYVVVDPISRLPRFVFSASVHSAAQGRYVSEDFFMNVIEPLVVSATRDAVKIILVHEQSRDHPFWWDRYPARHCRVHLQPDPLDPFSRVIYNGKGEQVAILDLHRHPVVLKLRQQTVY